MEDLKWRDDGKNFAVDRSLLTLWLSSRMEILCVSGLVILLASLIASSTPLYSASYMPWFFSEPSWWTCRWLVFAHHAAAAVFLSGTFEPSEYKIRCVGDVVSFFASSTALVSSFCMMKLTLAVEVTAVSGSTIGWGIKPPSY